MTKLKYDYFFYILFFCFFHRVQASSPSVMNQDPSTPSFRTEALQIDSTNPALFFNKGLEFINKKQTGLAIAYLREAQLLAPRHPGTKQALEYLQFQLKSKGFEQPDSLLGLFNDKIGRHFVLPEILSIHWVFTLITLVILTKLYRARRRAQWKSQPIPPWRFTHWTLGSLWVLISFILLLKIQVSLDQQGSIIQSGISILRSGPLPDAAELAQIPEGALVIIKDSYHDWLLVRYNEKPLGWVAKNDLLILTPQGFR